MWVVFIEMLAPDGRTLYWDKKSRIFWPDRERATRYPTWRGAVSAYRNRRGAPMRMLTEGKAHTVGVIRA